MTQLMLLGHDRTIYAVCNITYDAMSLIATMLATYVAAWHNLLIETRRSPIGVTRFALWYGAPRYALCRHPRAWINNIITLT